MDLWGQNLHLNFQTSNRTGKMCSYFMFCDPEKTPPMVISDWSSRPNKSKSNPAQSVLGEEVRMTPWIPGGQ